VPAERRQAREWTWSNTPCLKMGHGQPTACTDVGR
jgi:hypothetical protein